MITLIICLVIYNALIISIYMKIMHSNITYALDTMSTLKEYSGKWRFVKTASAIERLTYTSIFIALLSIGLSLVAITGLLLYLR